MTISEQDLRYLRRCVALAEESLTEGDQPFGSVLVSAQGAVLAEDHNQIHTNATFHPELTLAQWAAEHLSETERAQTTMYTSGEHCPMCAAAHAWAGLGRVVYICSAKQFATWCAEWGVPPSPVKALSINEVAPDIKVQGPVLELMEQVKALHKRYFGITE
ncbi:nucleoside deaminase [Oceanisphaera avium]|uniref:tRNA-specific adenosine deaminase n=1 Tax=Oceanisphaera avium TaxID=1903694 RepID=A0A1Y0CWN5_9GAMM|nr:nucleoside deaminase [Oceanisphaera avium]ART79763.1 tRNA-specific adenosine deaminase [Oceanisphaera avium]